MHQHAIKHSYPQIVDNYVDNYVDVIVDMWITPKSQKNTPILTAPSQYFKVIHISKQAAESKIA